MNKTFFVLGFLALAAGLKAGEKTIQVTPTTLQSWLVTSPDKAASGQVTTLTLPSGGQLSHRFNAEAVKVKITAETVFGLASEDLATLEVGPAAVVFTRDGSTGQVVLVMGDATPVVLPFTIKLNGDSSGIGSVDLGLSYDHVTGAVDVSGFGQTLHYATAVSSVPVEIVLSSGAHDPWVLQELTVGLSGVDDAAFDPNLGDKAADAQTSGAGKGSPSGKINSVPHGPGNGAIAAIDPASGARAAAQPQQTWVEVFTPSAVRRGRVDSVRISAAQAKKQ